MALVMLLGAGCAKTTPNTVENKTGENKTGEVGKTTAVSASGLAITKAESATAGTLTVEFAVGGELAQGATGYRLLLANEANPTWPTQGFWYELGPDHRSKVWRVPSGKRHLRVCAVKDNQCVEYSENLEVEVK